MSTFEQTTQKYKKKTIVLDDRSTPEARGTRLKRVRNLANLTRKEMCNDNDLNMYTLKGWEVGRHGGLPLDGAHKIVQCLAKEGVFCTVDWLLYEEGQPPRVIVGKTHDQIIDENNKSIDEIMIQDVLALFQKYYPATIYHQIVDDGMLPFYEVGDIVAGIPEENLVDCHSLNGLFCIVQLVTGEMLCRKIHNAKSESRFNLFCVNSSTEVENLIIANTELISVTPILWHIKPRKNNDRT